MYLADERLDMLPAELSADKCSLLGGQDRPAVSVLWTLSPGHYSVRHLWFGRTLIRYLLFCSHPDLPHRLPNVWSWLMWMICRSKASVIQEESD